LVFVSVLKIEHFKKITLSGQTVYFNIVPRGHRKGLRNTLFLVCCDQSVDGKFKIVASQQQEQEEEEQQHNNNNNNHHHHHNMSK
jgi:hypothetical protein